MPPQQPSSADLAKKYGGAEVADIAARFGGKPIEEPSATPIDPTQGRSAASRAIGGVITGSGLNPVPVIAGMAQEVGQQWENPSSAVTLPLRQALDVIAPLAHIPSAWKALTEGRFTDAANEAARSIPVIGPAAEHASQRMKSGDVAGGAGEVVGLTGSALLGAKRPTATGLTATVAERIGTAAERGSQRRMTSGIAPQTGANKIRFGNQAADVAPRLAREEGMGAASRADLADKVSARLEESTAALDAAHDARNAGHAYETAPIVKALQAEKEALTSKAVDASTTIPSASGPVKVRIGKDVIPPPHTPRVAVLDDVIGQLRELGSIARYDAIKNIRAAYDKVAKVKYVPAMGADLLAKAEEAAGAADVTRVLREHLAKIDPETATANKEYSYWRKVNDVIQAAEETERVRPSRARGLITRGIGAASGGAAGGGWGAIAGLIVAEGAERLVQSGATTKFAASRYMAKIADALKKGNDAQAKTNLVSYARLAGLSRRMSDLQAQQQAGKEPE